MGKQPRPLLNVQGGVYACNRAESLVLSFRR
jgi:hypothetical protein